MSSIELSFDPFAFAVAVAMLVMTALQLYWARPKHGHVAFGHRSGHVSGAISDPSSDQS